MFALILFACTAGSTSADSARDSPIGTAPTDTAPVPLEGTLTVTPDPDMVTRVTVSAALTAPVSLVVACEGDGEHPVPETFRVAAAEASDQPTLSLDGLLAETTYTCSAESHPGVEPVTFTTGALPAGLLGHGVTLERWETGAETGWTLINPWTFVTLTQHEDAYLVVLDMAAQVRWYQASPGDGVATWDFNADAQAFWTGGGLRTESPATAIGIDGGQLHQTSSVADHDVDWVGEHAWTLIEEADGSCIEQRRWVDDALGARVCMAELGLDGLLLNSLDVVAVDDGHVVYAGSGSSAHIVQVHAEQASLGWVYGPLQDFSGHVDFTYTHDVNRVPCDDHDVCLAYYDNGAESRQSAIEIVGLDEDARTATLLRTWTESGWYEARLGGIQVLAGDHLLVGIGHVEQSSPDGGPTRVVEVDGEDAIVWQAELTPATSAIYRARRVGPCDLFSHTGYCPEPE